MIKHITLVAIFLNALCSFSVHVPECRGQDCSFVPKELTQGEWREYRGRYENKEYGYSVLIPADLVGYDGANPLYQQGFGILLVLLCY